MGLQSLAADLGWEIATRLWIDSATAKSMASRKGAGRVRDLDVRQLWLQDVVRQGEVHVAKMHGVLNPPDALRDPKSKVEISRLLECVGARLCERSLLSEGATPPRPTVSLATIDHVAVSPPRSETRGRGVGSKRHARSTTALRHPSQHGGTDGAHRAHLLHTQVDPRRYMHCSACWSTPHARKCM